jgi:GT2 family glycosyltransferase
VLYLRNENGFGRMTASRNIGLRHATGDVIAFVDDDAFAHAGWLANLLETYRAADVGVVGGRALNGQPGEAEEGADRVGRLSPRGDLTGFFAADTGDVVEVDHVMGCNMSYRREVLARLGGFREDYPGISGVREDSDMCLRVRRAGYRVLFNPRACVDHVAAPQATGRRFDGRYIFYLQRNHVCMLVRNYGFGSMRVWRYMVYSVTQPLADFAKRVAGALMRLGINGAALVSGIASGTWLLLRDGRDPVRHDPGGREIGAALGAARAEAAKEPVKPALESKAGSL